MTPIAEFKQLVVFVLDISSSMNENGNIQGRQISKLDIMNSSLIAFYKDVINCSKTRYSLDLAIITTNDTVNIAQQPVSSVDIHFEKYSAKGDNKLLKEGILTANELVKERVSFYSSHHINYYRPIIVLISDWEKIGTQDNICELIKVISHVAQQNKMFSFGINGSNIHVQKYICGSITQMQLSTNAINNILFWLSESINNVDNIPDFDIPITSNDFLDFQINSYGKSQSSKNQNENNDKRGWMNKGSFFSRLLLNKQKNNRAYASVFAPSEISHNQIMLVQVYLHSKNEVEMVKSLALEADNLTKRYGYEPLDIMLKKGDIVDIKLTIHSDTLLYNNTKSIIWDNFWSKRSFKFLIPSDNTIHELNCNVQIFVNGATAGELLFITRIVTEPNKYYSYVFSKITRKLFISYSHKDFEAAERVAKIYEALGIDVFFDKHRLKAGYIYSENISDFIRSADSFVLCWSKNAASSEYVQRELNQALELAYPQYKPKEKASIRIYPYNIKPYAEPPQSMIDYYHFEDL